MTQETYTPIVVRFTFRPERAAEFLEGGQLVTQIDCDDIEEVMSYVTEFNDALTDACAIINNQVVSLAETSDLNDDEEA